MTIARRAHRGSPSASWRSSTSARARRVSPTSDARLATSTGTPGGRERHQHQGDRGAERRDAARPRAPQLVEEQPEEERREDGVEAERAGVAELVAPDRPDRGAAHPRARRRSPTRRSGGARRRCRRRARTSPTTRPPPSVPWPPASAGRRGRTAPRAALIGRKREFISVAAAIAAPAPPPAPTIEIEANCAEPANTIAEKTIASAGEKPDSTARMPNEMAQDAAGDGERRALTQPPSEALAADEAVQLSTK